MANSIYQLYHPTRINYSVEIDNLDYYSYNHPKDSSSLSFFCLCFIIFNVLNRLFFIKSIHSLIFFVISACLIYVLYCGITKTYNLMLVLAISAIIFEGVALLLNQGRCPLTTFTERQGAEKGSVTDIFLPAWMARNTFRISTVLFTTGIVLLAFRYFTGS